MKNPIDRIKESKPVKRVTRSRPVKAIKDAHPIEAIKTSKAVKAVRKSAPVQAIAGSKPAKAIKRTARKARRKVSTAMLDTGDPNTPLGKRTRRQLYNRARELGVKGRSKMNKGQLVAAIRRAS